MTTSYWTNDDGPPRKLIRVRDGETAFYRDGAWHIAHWAYRRIMNGDGVDLVPADSVPAILDALDARDPEATRARE